MLVSFVILLYHPSFPVYKMLTMFLTADEDDEE